ncbi:MAG: hypothetical protein HQL24_10165 [Candidatus Omnitrophica bacterium]|nr:hypothetical protein [Candidatus Omnitrophota bacterium]
MIRYHYGGAVCATLIVLLMTSLGWCGVQQENQGILAGSRIKKNSFKKEIVQRIKKTLPERLKKCSIVVTNIKLLRADDEFNVAEEWTIDTCQEAKVYFVSTSTSPKGYWINSVTTREERFALEKKTLREWKAFLNDEKFTKGFYYLEEILNNDEFKKRIEEDKNTPIKNIEYKIGNQTYQQPIKEKKKE